MKRYDILLFFCYLPEVISLVLVKEHQWLSSLLSHDALFFFKNHLITEQRCIIAAGYTLSNISDGAFLPK